MHNPEVVYANNGFKLLESYKNCKTKHKCSCLKCGFITFNTLHKIHKKGKCKNCKHIIIIEEFKKQFCELLEEPSLTKPMKYVCNCGNISKIKWQNFKNSSRCKKCAIQKTKENNPKRLNIKNKIKTYFKENNCELLNTKYINQSSELYFICECGNISTTTWKSFQKGCRCQFCAKIKIKNRYIPSGENHFRWNKDRCRISLNKTIRNRIKKSLKRTLKTINKNKTSKTFDMLGYTKEQLIYHIEHHPNWNNIKHFDWELDHHFPIKAFIDYKIYNIKLINCLENLNPLEKSKNRSKNDSYSKKEFEKWLLKKQIPFNS